MQIKSGGKMHKARWIFPAERAGKMRLMVALETEKTLAQIAQDFDGAAVIEKSEENKPGIVERFEGFTRLMIISRENEDGLTILTLGRA